ncbi:hypothetical protein C0J45_23174, partial [Silurus meridionalis]
MRMTTQVALDHLSPYELVLGRPFPLPWHRGKQALGTGDLDVHLSEYAAGLLQTLDDYWTQVSEKKTQIPTENTHPFKVGDRVLVKKLDKMGTPLGETTYSAPADVIAVTRTAVLTDLFPQWIHAGRVK